MCIRGSGWVVLAVVYRLWLVDRRVGSYLLELFDELRSAVLPLPERVDLAPIAHSFLLQCSDVGEAG